MPIQHDLPRLARDFGINFMEQQRGYLDPQARSDIGLAMDAQPGLITVSNGGIPAYLANYLDPELVQVLVTPIKAAQIYGEAKKGDWTTLSAQFPVVESTGEVNTYGDYADGGQTSANVNWVPRQSYHYQTVTQWGERELEMAGLARIDYASRLNIASALTINKALNKMYFFGIAGLENYGALNDPDLVSPIQPGATGTGSSRLWADKDGQKVYDDIQALYTQLQKQLRGVVERDAPMVLALSPTAEANLTKTNQYNVNVTDQIRKNFPNLRIETAVEFETDSGELVQMFVEEIDGQQTAYCAFTEKMRAHPVIPALSSFKQKKSAGGWGCVIRRPVAIAQMLGV